MNVGNAENAKAAERSGRKKRRSKRKAERAKQRARRERERAAKREAEEQERLRKWEECWERKFQEQEERDRAECCMGEGLCLKPRTQSNIWINVVRDRSIQEIQMTFKHVPVPRPKPPPLPPALAPDPADQVIAEKSILRKTDKKSGTAKKGKK